MTHTGHASLAEPLYLKTAMGRQVIGEVAYCIQCKRPYGDVKKDIKCPPSFNETSWQVMLKVHPDAPYWFIERDGLIVPENYKGEE